MIFEENAGKIKQKRAVLKAARFSIYDANIILLLFPHNHLFWC